MAFIGKFIGANNYLDPNIRNLSGAGRDALAMWALFTDTFPEIDAELLVDDKASIDNIRRSFKETLESAGSEDTLILFYSGHGSHNHRICAHNTFLSDLDNTTFSMEELASLFKSSPAKSIICVLDCCFSGGAPAKVLEDSPIPKDIGNPLEGLLGKGRMIIAASNFDEPSYELGTTGHGILTKALIDTLQSSEKDVNLLSAMDKIMEIVRTEASRIGVTQTPVILNHIEGGFVLRSLKPGDNFYSAFPQTKGINITQDISELLQFGFNKNLVSEWQRLFKNGLNQLQLKAINEYRILDGESLLVIAPTSSGKTFVGELASVRTISEGKKSVFLLPYRALVNEKYDQFSTTYGKLGYTVIRCTGDYLDQTEAFVKGKYDIALLTYEMFLNLSVSVPIVLNNMGLVVLDEAQFITDPMRGITVELLLTHLIFARNRGLNPQLVILSAVIGNSNYLEEWLGCKKLITTERPIPLIEGVLDRTGIFKNKDSSGKINEEQMLPPGSILQRRNEPSAQDIIVPLVKNLIEQNEKVIVFRNQRGNAEGCAGYLASELGLASADDVLLKLPKHASSSTSQNLKNALAGGVAFHNSNLSREERIAVEQSFRDPDSKLRVLAATTTLAAGLNTPASTVVLAEQQFLGEEGRPFTVAEYKNMAGRAGRVGFNEQGKSIILTGEGFSLDNLFARYVLGQPEDLRSSFDVNDLDTWVIRLLVQVKGVAKEEVFGLLANTYGGYIQNRSNPSWHTEMEVKVKEMYQKMVELGLVEEENNTVHLTLLGKACGESVFSFKSAMRLVELLKGFSTAALSAHDLMAVVQALPESDASYTPQFKKGTSESVWPGEASNRYRHDIIQTLQRYTNGDEFTYYARCKKVAVLHDWISGVPTETIESYYKSRHPYYGNIGYGDIRRFADLTRFQLRSAYKIASLIYPDKILDEKAVDNLLKSLEIGIPDILLPLLEIPVRMSREEYLSLNDAGISNKETLLAADENLLRQLLETDTFDEVKKINEK